MQCILFILLHHRFSLTFLYSGSKATETLFEGHQLSLEYLVKNLLKLYVDIEFTGSHTQVTVSKGCHFSVELQILFNN